MGLPPSPLPRVCKMGYRCSEGTRVAFLMDFWHMFRLNKLEEEKQQAGEASIGTGLFMNGGEGAEWGRRIQRKQKGREPEPRREEGCALPSRQENTQMVLLRTGLGGRPGSSLLMFLLSLRSGRLGRAEREGESRGGEEGLGLEGEQLGQGEGAGLTGSSPLLQPRAVLSRRECRPRW